MAVNDGVHFVRSAGGLVDTLGKCGHGARRFREPAVEAFQIVTRNAEAVRDRRGGGCRSPRGRDRGGKTLGVVFDVVEADRAGLGQIGLQAIE
jgi:hypothetical protein